MKQNLTDGQLRAELRRIAERRVALDAREKELVTEARSRRWTWETLGALLGISRAGVQKRYPGLPGRVYKNDN